MKKTKKVVLVEKLEKIGYYSIDVETDTNKVTISYQAKRFFSKEPIESDWHDILKIYFEKYPEKIDDSLSTSMLIKESIETILEEKEVLTKILKNLA